MNLGHTITLCRKINCLTQAQLAAKSGFSVSHICLIEKGKRVPTLSTLKTLSDVFDVPVSVLVFLAARPDEIKELNESEFKDLSDTIVSLIEDVYKQKSLF